MTLPTVSVIMATYNHANFVAEAIESVLSQIEVDFEFLISDDGSSDNTRDVIASISDERISFFPNKINRGAGIVVNELIQKSSGEFIALINSDDSWISNSKLVNQLQIMQENPTVGACFGRAKFIDKAGKQIDKSTLPFGKIFDQHNRSRGKWLRYFFDNANCICHPTMLIRKACYDKVGFYKNSMRQIPDFDMWIRLVKYYDIYICEQELINFRILPGENASSQTSDNSIRTINEHYLIASEFFDDVDNQTLLDGFSDLLRNKELSSEEHVAIEKVLLYLYPNQWLGKAYKMIGLLGLYRLLNSDKHRHILQSEYSIDDRWFQDLTSDIDILRPKILANLSGSKEKIKGFWRKITKRLFA